MFSICSTVLPILSAIDVDGATECNTPFDPSRLDDLSSDSDDEYFDVVAISALRQQPPPLKPQPNPLHSSPPRHPTSLPPTAKAYQLLTKASGLWAMHKLSNMHLQPNLRQVLWRRMRRLLSRLPVLVPQTRTRTRNHRQLPLQSAVQTNKHRKCLQQLEQLETEHCQRKSSQNNSRYPVLPKNILHQSLLLRRKMRTNHYS
nr:uncharacterized protein LOC113804109 [Penaeus vannamei]